MRELPCPIAPGCYLSRDGFLDNATRQQIVTAYLCHRQHADISRSHFFNGRFENVYITGHQIPELSQLVEILSKCAADVLGLAAETVRIGYWINDMGPGETTGLHTHDEDDEYLSGVYYLQVPETSGDLILYGPCDSRQIVPPLEDRLVLFHPATPHEVTINCSGQLRLSLGLNFGPMG